MLLGRCPVDPDEAADETDGPAHVLVLSDPDLLDNWGLARGDNAQIASDLVAGLAEEGAIVVDNTTWNWTIDGWTPPERSWADLARFFAFPLSLLWAGFLALAVLVLWRAAVRDGPPIPEDDDGLRPSKTVSVAARARLLRLSGRDAALVRLHVQDRMQALAADLLGPRRGAGSSASGELGRVLARRDPAAAAELAALSAADAIPDGTPSVDLLAIVDRLETLTEKVLHDPGRPAQSR
ncbi:hypothetical protein [Methylobrevis pamukkalensis]|uniref:DUF4350 domain-containing protein n=1 Tax=Methylobrevis pamukkalensis TaxID=1439726 RepID=A0A1E3H5P9_9HYPH|nr:hypothetical protein [Methylobrevis pamukkalensis]ODN71642.1 hypothetical protein A6302_00979 [Methylobrevis pamukkalensis]